MHLAVGMNWTVKFLLGLNGTFCIGCNVGSWRWQSKRIYVSSMKVTRWVLSLRPKPVQHISFKAFQWNGPRTIHFSIRNIRMYVNCPLTRQLFPKVFFRRPVFMNVVDSDPLGPPPPTCLYQLSPNFSNIYPIWTILTDWPDLISFDLSSPLLIWFYPFLPLFTPLDCSRSQDTKGLSIKVQMIFVALEVIVVLLGPDWTKIMRKNSAHGRRWTPRFVQIVAVMPFFKMIFAYKIKIN